MTFTLLLSSAYAPLAHAHGDHDELALEELVEIYQTLYREMRQSMDQAPGTQSNPTAYYAQSALFTNSDAIGSLLQRVLKVEQKHACEHHGVCEHGHDPHHDHDHASSEYEALFAPKPPLADRAAGSFVKLLGWFDGKVKTVVSFLGLQLPGLTFDGAKEYGFSFVAYTTVTEVFEHVILNIHFPVFCKLLQGAFFSTIGMVMNLKNIWMSELGDESSARRLKAAYLAVRNEVKFKFSGRYNRVTFDPAFEAMKQGTYDDYADALGKELGTLHHFLLATQFWGDVYASVENQTSRSVSEAQAQASLKQHFLGDGPMDVRTKHWRAHRLASFLNLFVDIIRSASLRDAEERLFKLKLSPSQYARFLRVRLVLGATAKTLNRLKSELYALISSSDRPENEERLQSIFAFIQNDVLPFLAILPNVAPVDASSLDLKMVRLNLKLLIQKEKELIRSRWDSADSCSDALGPDPEEQILGQN